MGPRQASLLLHERLCAGIDVGKTCLSARTAGSNVPPYREMPPRPHRSAVRRQAGARRTRSADPQRIYLDLFQRVRMILRNPKVEDAFDGVISNLRVL